MADTHVFAHQSRDLSKNCQFIKNLETIFIISKDGRWKTLTMCLVIFAVCVVMSDVAEGKAISRKHHENSIWKTDITKRPLRVHEQVFRKHGRKREHRQDIMNREDDGLMKNTTTMPPVKDESKRLFNNQTADDILVSSAYISTVGVVSDLKKDSQNETKDIAVKNQSSKPSKQLGDKPKVESKSSFPYKLFSKLKSTDKTDVKVNVSKEKTISEPHDQVSGDTLGAYESLLLQENNFKDEDDPNFGLRQRFDDMQGRDDDEHRDDNDDNGEENDDNRYGTIDDNDDYDFEDVDDTSLYGNDDDYYYSDGEDNGLNNNDNDEYSYLDTDDDQDEYDDDYYDDQDDEFDYLSNKSKNEF